jgi:hypothetical protein
MWKKLFNGALKHVSKDENIIDEKNNRNADIYRKEIINEFEQDFERQQQIKEVDEHLDYLIKTNNLCNYCLTLLEDPKGNSYIMDFIIDEVEFLQPKAIELLESGEFMSEEYQQIMIGIVSPFLDVSKIMMGDKEEENSNGVLGFYISFLNSEDENYELWDELRLNTSDFLYETKRRIRENFIENKSFQVTTYNAYGINGEVDFGYYTLDDLDD